MTKKDEILTAFAEEMQRHNSVKRRIALLSEIIVLGWLLIFAIFIFCVIIFLGVRLNELI